MAGTGHAHPSTPSGDANWFACTCVCYMQLCVYVGICVLQEPIQQHQRPLTPTEACVSNITVNEVQEY